MQKLVEIISHFQKFEELKIATLEYVKEIQNKNWPGRPQDKRQIPLQIAPWRNDIWDSVSWLKPGMKESDYNTFLPELQGSIFEELTKSMPTKVCRLRIIRLEENGYYPIHTDHRPRIHVPIITHSECAFLFPEHDYMKTMAANGDVYWADVTKPHTFINWGKNPRIHLLMSIVDNNYKP